MEVLDGHAAMGSPRKSPGNRRPRLLHSWGSSLVSVAHKIYRKAAETENRIGNLVRILAWMASPFLHPIQQRWLATLSFIDDRIFTVEKIAMAIFPPTTHIFTKVDELAFLGQSLPQKLDDAMDSLLPLLHQLPLFDEVMMYVFAEKWSSNDERDIMVDTNYYDEQQRKVVETSSEEKSDSGNEGEEIAKLSHDTAWNSKSTESNKKEDGDTCKEIMSALEGMGMTAEKKEGEGEVSKKKKAKETDRVELDDAKVVKSDPILELFDEGWQLKPIGAKVEDLAEQVEVSAEMDEQQELLAAEKVDPVEEQAELFMDNYAHRTSKCRNISHISPVW